MDVQEVKNIWQKVKDELEVSVPSHIFNLWIRPLEAVDFENNTLVILSPQQLSVDILKKDWNKNIKSAVKSVLGENCSFSLNYDADLSDKYIKNRKKELAKVVAGQTENDRKNEDKKQSLAQMQSDANLNLNLKFDNFVVGDNSKFAYNAAFSVANNPSKKFNPLFIYGASGLGKTHLLQAIGHYILFNTKLKVRYVRTEDYHNEWIKCFQLNEQNGKSKINRNNSMFRKFHQKFQNVDVLLIDDIQFLESREKIAVDFFSTFEALYTNNKQIVIASDRQPRDIPKLDERLRTRFEMGLVVDIVPPDYETRFEIVKAYSKELEVKAEDDVFAYIAENFPNNVRELKGAFNKVSAYAEFLNMEINLETAQKALKGDIRKKEITPALIAQNVAKYYDITVKDLKGTARQQRIAQARHIAIYLTREMLEISYESIGEFYSKKHTTVMYSYDMISEKLRTDDALKLTIKDIKEMIK
ncbi:chromosomal replication initiator protein DnaA [bacterium]|nr:chromosomal replication initiator protein DnaA [bacterium]